MMLSLSTLLSRIRSSLPQRCTTNLFVLFIELPLSIHCYYMQKQLEHTSKLLASATEELKQTKYALTEKDYIILQQRKAGP